MIVAERKAFDQLWESVKFSKSMLILGCGTCVSVCQAGGEKEVGLLASEIRMKIKLDGADIKIDEKTIERQCDREFIEAIRESAGKYDVVLSMACGAGVQLLAEVLETVAEGIWAEKCRACGECLLGEYGGICPVTVCAKGLLNGPCGGSKAGKCEASSEKDCAWVMIYNRLKKQNRLDDIRGFSEAKHFSAQAHPGKYVNDAYLKPVMEEKSGK
jgi:ferredoxin